MRLGRARSFIALAVLALAVSACGGASSPVPSGVERSPATSAGTSAADASPSGSANESASAGGGGASNGSTAPAGSSGPAASGSAGGGGGSGGSGGASGGGGAGGSTSGSPNPALDIQNAFVQVVDKVSPSVVVIETASGLGSGVVFDTKGDIVTNAHVVGSDKSFRITTATGQRLTGSLVGTFPPNDIAVVRASGGNLQPATFGDSKALVVGDLVLAIGNPLGLQSSVTDGIVSATGRTVAEPGGAALPDVIQTSAPINPGNSGGALANLAGEVIGIPTLAATDPQLGGSAPGIGFAIASNTAKDIATQLIEHGKVVSSHRAYLGIRAADVQGGQGVLVYSVAPNGPAGDAGIPADVLITSVAGQPTPDTETLSTVLAGLQPGQKVPVEVTKADGTKQTYQVTLGELPG